MKSKKNKVKGIKCGCKKTKKNRLQKAVSKSQKPKPKPKITEEMVFMLKSKTRKKSNKKTTKKKKY